jgi:N-acetylmuramoyl-L-alanine amidase
MSAITSRAGVMPASSVNTTIITFLRGLAMPAVVVEVGFLTNATEADALVGADYAERMAQGIIAAVQRYCDATEGADASDQIEDTETQTNPVVER